MNVQECISWFNTLQSQVLSSADAVSLDIAINLPLPPTPPPNRLLSTHQLIIVFQTSPPQKTSQGTYRTGPLPSRKQVDLVCGQP
jgi:hypothetical protein